MASSSFGNRVDEIFGSLGSSLPSWRLSDQQLPPNKWISGRERCSSRDDAPCASSFHPSSCCPPPCQRPVHGSADGVSDADDDDDSDGMDADAQDAFQAALAGADDAGEEEGRLMRGMVGLDPTLDFEDEEDEFDKTAVGLEGNAERLYMREIKGSDRKADSSFSPPISFHYLGRPPKDPRANFQAAIARLKEDDKEAAASSDRQNGTNTGGKRSRECWTKDADCKPSQSAMSAKEEGKDKPVKRVRFALDVKQDIESSAGKEMDEQAISVKPRVRSSYASVVPDHVRNPAKYTHYTLDWSEEDNDKSNMEAFRACAEIVSKKLTEGCERPEEPPQRIQFIPRLQKSWGAGQKGSNQEADPFQACPVGIAACQDAFKKQSERPATLSNVVCSSDTEESATATEEDFEGTSVRAPRRYRSKKGVEEAEERMEI